ncbi:MAG: reverse transcriptase family protein [Saprospiraceae bacterium]
MEKQTLARHRQNKAIFCHLNSISALCRVLKTDKRKLTLMAQQPKYKTFSIAKKDGGERLIETPDDSVKKILGILNRYLQSVYLLEKTNAAYGFITGVKNDDDRRNVLTNAKKHLGKAYLLNIDLKDFFHSISKEQVITIFKEKPFRFKGEVLEILASICTYQGRLPMGTPTSPVLSNFACRLLDESLSAFSADMLWTYTRYADDMSFSSNQIIAAEKIHSVRQLIEKMGFKVNEKKVVVFGPDDNKVVTGLLVNEKIELAPGYLDELEEEIIRLGDVLRTQNEQGQISTHWIEKYKQQVRGRISFAGFVLQRRDERYMALRDAYYVAINPPEEEFGAINWRGFPYNM